MADRAKNDLVFHCPVQGILLLVPEAHIMALVCRCACKVLPSVLRAS